MAIYIPISGSYLHPSTILVWDRPIRPVLADPDSAFNRQEKILLPARASGSYEKQFSVVNTYYDILKFKAVKLSGTIKIVIKWGWYLGGGTPVIRVRLYNVTKGIYYPYTSHTGAGSANTIRESNHKVVNLHPDCEYILQIGAFNETTPYFRVHEIVAYMGSDHPNYIIFVEHYLSEISINLSTGGGTDSGSASGSSPSPSELVLPTQRVRPSGGGGDLLTPKNY